MTDSIKAWIEERRAIHTAATPGPWETDKSSGSLSAGPIDLLAGTATSEGYVRDEDDATAIVDAHNNLPRALDALSKVLELHTESKWGFCTQCMEIGEHDWMLAVQWPCPTVRAIVGAINGE